MIKSSDIWAAIQSILSLAADGIPGKRTLAGVSQKLGCQASWQAVQRAIGVPVDGVPGQLTASKLRDLLSPQLKSDHKNSHSTIWPRQKDVPAFFGQPGSNLVTISLPYEMKLAWDPKKTISRMTMHKKVAAATERIYRRVLEHYGEDLIRDLRLDLHGGSYNKRRMVGGSNWSMHAYGIAIDIDPEHNQLKWGRDKASLARSEYDAFWRIVEDEGAVSLGRERNYDWMHFQFARL